MDGPLDGVHASPGFQKNGLAVWQFVDVVFDQHVRKAAGSYGAPA